MRTRANDGGDGRTRQRRTTARCMCRQTRAPHLSATPVHTHRATHAARNTLLACRLPADCRHTNDDERRGWHCTVLQPPPHVCQGEYRQRARLVRAHRPRNWLGRSQLRASPATTCPHGHRPPAARPTCLWLLPLTVLLQLSAHVWGTHAMAQHNHMVVPHAAHTTPAPPPTDATARRDGLAPRRWLPRANWDRA